MTVESGARSGPEPPRVPARQLGFSSRRPACILACSPPASSHEVDRERVPLLSGFPPWPDSCHRLVRPQGSTPSALSANKSMKSRRSTNRSFHARRHRARNLRARVAAPFRRHQTLRRGFLLHVPLAWFERIRMRLRSVVANVGLLLSMDLAGTLTLPTDAFSQDQPAQDLFAAAPAPLD